MSLVQYPASSEEDSNDDGEPVALKRKRKRTPSAELPLLPPLPASFHDLYAANARVSTSDDPSLHGGRKRAVPHVEGNWPSHVYLEWIPSQAESQALHGLIDRIKCLIEADIQTKQYSPTPAAPNITPSLLSPLGTPLPLHISLSRTLQIKTEDKESFCETLSTSLRKAAVRPFHVRFSQLKWVSNFERNRWFLVLVVEKPPQNELNRLLAACNEAARRCGHPGLYTGGKGDGPMDDNRPNVEFPKRVKMLSGDEVNAEVDYTERFHVSIAWNLVEPDPAWVKLVQDLDISTHVGALGISFEAVKAKIGNAVSSIDLTTKKPTVGLKGGLLGLG